MASGPTSYALGSASSADPVVTERPNPPAHCISCKRQVRPGVKCVSAWCPFQKTVNRFGVVVLDRPLTKRWIT